MKKLFVWGGWLLLLSSCTKSIETYPFNNYSKVLTAENATPFTRYTIKTGEHYCDKNNPVYLQTDELKFRVRFNASALYKTVKPENQYDINKLYGFSDNQAQHHDYSARFGWRYSDNALRLFAYVYNKGVQSNKEIRLVKPGFTYTCSIKVVGGVYEFNANGIIVTMPRQAKTPKALGYKLYPYFGGDEVAPQEIMIDLKDL